MKLHRRLRSQTHWVEVFEFADAVCRSGSDGGGSIVCSSGGRSSEGFLFLSRTFWRIWRKKVESLDLFFSLAAVYCWARRRQTTQTVLTLHRCLNLSVVQSDGWKIRLDCQRSVAQLASLCSGESPNLWKSLKLSRQQPETPSFQVILSPSVVNTSKYPIRTSAQAFLQNLCCSLCYTFHI